MKNKLQIIYTGEQTTTDHGRPVKTGAVITTIDAGEIADLVMSGISGERWLNKAIENGEWEITA